MQIGLPFSATVPVVRAATGEVRECKPWKRSRQISRQSFTHLRDSGELGRRQQVFADALTAHMNRFNHPPTLAELTQWAFNDKRINRNDPNIFRPRATEFAIGKVIRRKDGSTTVIGGGAIEYLEARICAVTGAMARPIRPREAGSEEPR
jgi:hypothetical protein